MKCYWCKEEIKDGILELAFIYDESGDKKAVAVCRECYPECVERCDSCGLPFTHDYLNTVTWHDLEGDTLCQECFDVLITLKEV